MLRECGSGKSCFGEKIFPFVFLGDFQSGRECELENEFGVNFLANVHLKTNWAPLLGLGGWVELFTFPECSASGGVGKVVLEKKYGYLDFWLIFEVGATAYNELLTMN